MTNDPYSPLLVFALVNLALAAVTLAAHRYRPRVIPQWLPQLAVTMALLGVMLALAGHAMLGHRHGTTDAMSLTGFVIAHPAPFLIGSLALVLIVLSRRQDAA